jgi:high-affinity K+ transport system ATPase subunit B
MATNCAAEAGEGARAAFPWTGEVIAGLAQVQESGSTGGEA